MPFLRPDLWITLTDPYRAGHELDYFPGSVNFERADIILISKVGYAEERNIAAIEANARRLNPSAAVLRRRSPLEIPEPSAIKQRRVLAIEDGPTVTHGGMPFGAAVLAAKECGAAELVDPRPFAVGEIAETFRQYPHIGKLLPAMGYGESQIRDLEATINAADCDLVLIATPIDLTRLLHIDRPHMRIRYSLQPEDGALTAAVERILL